ncbi:MAG TPA: NAD(P)H-dependent glycerol-3-phosphate dehydrogenase [Candidatus Cloacimonadota bacterium]|nr:NAD(P)H-dependent glycerol-3-phosphate dehydrogenase [Candidatus Cloacimonadota bacterium]
MEIRGKHIAILGGGAWGLALAKLLSENGHLVRLWEFNPKYVEVILEKRTNPYLLDGITIPESIFISNHMPEVLHELTDYIVLAIPSQFLRSSIHQHSNTIASLQHLKGIVNVAKGVEENSLKRMSGIIHDELPQFPIEAIMTLSGPSHAEEVARKIPTAVVIAGKNEVLLRDIQEIFSNPYFRVYRSHDLVGVEIGGAVKNIISIAAGIIDGIGYGDNTKGALLIRGIVEIQRLGVALGANAETFLGLSGMGDLITTAISPHSRNRHVGFEIGKGKKLQVILSEMKAVAEGVASTKSVYDLKTKYQIEMPITEEIYQVLFHDKSPLEAIVQLMTRSLKEEV